MAATNQSFDTLPGFGENNETFQPEYGFMETYDRVRERESTQSHIRIFEYGQPILDEELKKAKQKDPEIDWDLNIQQMSKMYQMYQDGTLMDPKKQSAYGDNSVYAKYKRYFDKQKEYGLKSPEEILKETMAKKQEVYDRLKPGEESEDFWGGFAGSMVSMVSDPGNWATPFQAWANVAGGEFIKGNVVKQLPKVFATEFAANAATQPEELLNFKQARKEVGVNTTTKDLIIEGVMNSTLGAVFGTTLNGVTHTAGKAFTKEIQQDSPELASTVESLNADNVTDIDAHMQNLEAVEDGVEITKTQQEIEPQPQPKTPEVPETPETPEPPTKTPEPKTPEPKTPEPKTPGEKVAKEIIDFDPAATKKANVQKIKETIRPSSLIQRNLLDEDYINPSLNLTKREENLIELRGKRGAKEAELDYLEQEYDVTEITRIDKMTDKEVLESVGKSGQKKTRAEIAETRQQLKDEIMDPDTRKRWEQLKRDVNNNRKHGTKRQFEEDTLDAKLELLEEAEIEIQNRKRKKEIVKKAFEEPKTDPEDDIDWDAPEETPEPKTDPEPDEWAFLDDLDGPEPKAETTPEPKDPEPDPEDEWDFLLEEEFNEAIDIKKPETEQEAIQAINKAKEIEQKAQDKEIQKAKEQIKNTFTPENVQKAQEATEKLETETIKDQMSIKQEEDLTQSEIDALEEMLSCL